MNALTRTLAPLLIVLSLSFGAGCSYSQMHGYSVVRTDSSVRYRPGHFQLHVEPGTAALAAEPLVAGLHAGLADRAPRFVPSDDGRFAVTVRVDDARFEAGRTTVVARVQIAEPDGEISSELAMEHTVAGEGEDAHRQIGEVLGERLGHYLTERERFYHW